MAAGAAPKGGVSAPPVPAIEGSAAVQDCSTPPEYSEIRVVDFYFSWDVAREVYARSYHCALPRIPYLWQPRADGSAWAVVVRDGAEFGLRVPKAFVEKTIAHIEAVLKAGHGRYLYAVDFNHGHLQMPEAYFTAKYGDLDYLGVFPAILADPGLEVIYHPQEHIKPKTPPREFLGKYDDASRVIATLELEARGLSPRAGVRRFPVVEFVAHPEGEYSLSDGTRFDFSFEGPAATLSYLRALGVVLEWSPERRRLTDALEK